MSGPLWYLAQGTNLDLRVFQFRPQAGNVSNQVVAAIVVAVLVVVLGTVAYFFFRRRRHLVELNLQREEARLRLLMSELNLGESEQRLMEVLAGSEEPGDLIPLLESRKEFEETLLRFRDANPDHPALRRMSSLRQRLEYGFSNHRNPFVDTRMLAPGLRMRCKIGLPKRDVTFLTTLLGVNEDHFIIRPPTAKGKPVSLGSQSHLQFRVSRENDAEYEFTARVIAQLPTGNQAVLLAHTRDISRMLFRHANRVVTAIAVQFFVIRQEFAADRSAAQLKVLDSQYRFDGSIVDLSIGGALVMAKGRQERLHEGDVVVFRLPGAQMRDDVVSQVVGSLSMEAEDTQIHLQFMGMKELNRLKLSKFLAALKESAAPPAEAAEAAAPHAP
jgi:hypothetical protein